MTPTPFSQPSHRRPLIKHVLFSCMVCAPAVFLGSCASQPSASDSQPAAGSVATAADSEQSLLTALNAHRRQAGKPALALSSKLGKLARAESSAAASTTGFKSGGTDRLRRLSGFNSLGTLHGVLKDRGPQTGSSFIDYWKQEPDSALVGNWNEVGVGISKSTDGRLFAILIFGGGGSAGGSSLMRPMFAR